ncbi:MAG: hypothetical protein IPH49_14720 [Ignavibacteria bacterium]|nr:hypothetical protein [Ignavibacteria bacterium]
MLRYASYWQIMRTEAPYPTSIHAVAAFRAVTPDSLQYLIDDLFENITLFSNRVESSSEEEGRCSVAGYGQYSFREVPCRHARRETPVVLQDYIDVGVFAEAAKGQKLGKPLAMRRVKVTRASNTYTFNVPERPANVGIDPYNVLVDRIPDDNVKAVE